MAVPHLLDSAFFLITRRPCEELAFKSHLLAAWLHVTEGLLIQFEVDMPICRDILADEPISLFSSAECKERLRPSGDIKRSLGDFTTAFTLRFRYVWTEFGHVWT